MSSWMPRRKGVIGAILVIALAAVGAFVLVRTMLFEQDPCSAESIAVLAGAGSDLTARIPGFQVEGQRGCDSGTIPGWTGAMATYGTSSLMPARPAVTSPAWIARSGTTK